MTLARSPWFWAVVAAVLAAEGPPSAGAKTAPRPARVLLIGDSLAVGLAAPLRNELEQRGVAFRSIAKGGANAGQFVVEGGFGTVALAATLPAFKPDVILASLGTNDTAPGSSLAPKLPERFARLRQRAAEHGAALVFLEPPTLPWSREPIERAAKAATSPLVKAPELEHAPDRIHLTPAGYRAWAEFVRKEVLP